MLNQNELHEETREVKNEKIDTYIATLKVEYEAEFVPISQSRNADGKWLSLNWKIKLGRKRGDLTGWQLITDYGQGIAHAPGYEHSWNQSGHQTEYFKIVAEKGRTAGVLPKLSNGKVDWYEAKDFHGYKTGKWRPIPPPLLRDILYSLISDSDVIDYAGFEDWAGNFGYETDSRKAEETYKACMDIALKLRALIGEKAMSELRVLFEDY